MTHTGEFMGIPATNRRIMLNTIDIYAIENEKVVEVWHVEDLLGLLGQMK